MTHKLATPTDLWTFQAAGTHYYVTQKRGGVVMTSCDYSQTEARELYAYLINYGNAHAV